MATREAKTHAQPPRLARGFTLIEIAVVLVVIAAALGALLPLFTAQTTNARISATRAHQEAIKAALITYVGRHGYLPCPSDGYAKNTDTGYGHEARSANHFDLTLSDRSCDRLSGGRTPTTQQQFNPTGNFAIPTVTTYRGVIPWLDLGLPEDVASDGWNQRISYVVTSLGVQGYATREAAGGLLGGLVLCSDYNTTSAQLLTPVAGFANTLCSSPSSATPPIISTLSAAVALISHGENGYGAFMAPAGSAAGTVKPYALASAAETANIDLTQGLLVQAPYSRNFDDVVMWLTPADLTGPLIQSGALPAPQQLMTARFLQARQAIVASMVMSSGAVQTSQLVSAPPGPPGNLQWQSQLCLPIVDVNGNNLFASHYSSDLGDQLATNILPAGSTTSNNPTRWAFSYEGSGDLADGDQVRDLTRAAQVNYDPWGSPLLYTQALRDNHGNPTATLVTATTPAVPANPYAFILYSVGPDGIPNTADDAAYGVTVADLQAAQQRVLNPVVSAPIGTASLALCPALPGG